ncbi:uncharacterized protein DUF4192 [Stackebrandtia endophytica]|uniref:Uncharacterized protein DUF4192 n=1 Tax=Stackebrandtia endophytica TaxID=1496996 RepID=A0A543AS26_9ACTN|nr:DUF4192 family protein [Stackebrandtia endophytica]TQL75382.1 uncharacterized protein DUF4192 [Stackebrandtia endophytica]
MSITFTGIGQVLAAVPHLLGFYPTDDVIIVKLHDDQIGELLRRHPLACVPLPPPDTDNADKVLVIAYGSDEHSFTSASAVTMMTAQQFADHGITANPLGVFDGQWTRLKGLGEATILVSGSDGRPRYPRDSRTGRWPHS